MQRGKQVMASTCKKLWIDLCILAVLVFHIPNAETSHQQPSQNVNSPRSLNLKPLLPYLENHSRDLESLESVELQQWRKRKQDYYRYDLSLERHQDKYNGNRLYKNWNDNDRHHRSLNQHQGSHDKPSSYVGHKKLWMLQQLLGVERDEKSRHDNRNRDNRHHQNRYSGKHYDYRPNYSQHYHQQERKWQSNNQLQRVDKAQRPVLRTGNDHRQDDRDRRHDERDRRYDDRDQSLDERDRLNYRDGRQDDKDRRENDRDRRYDDRDQSLDERDRQNDRDRRQDNRDRWSSRDQRQDDRDWRNDGDLRYNDGEQKYDDRERSYDDRDRRDERDRRQDKRDRKQYDRVLSDDDKDSRDVRGLQNDRDLRYDDRVQRYYDRDSRDYKDHKQDDRDRQYDRDSRQKDRLRRPDDRYQILDSRYQDRHDSDTYNNRYVTEYNKRYRVSQDQNRRPKRIDRKDRYNNLRSRLDNLDQKYESHLKSLRARLDNNFQKVDKSPVKNLLRAAEDLECVAQLQCIKECVTKKKDSKDVIEEKPDDCAKSCVEKIACEVDSYEELCDESGPESCEKDDDEEHGSTVAELLELEKNACC